jgi:hypothetical protein
MMTYSDLWESYRDLPWWKQLLLVLPVTVLLIFLGVIPFLRGGTDTNQTMLKESKRKTDQEIKDLRELLIITQSRLDKIDSERTAIKKQLQEIETEYLDFSRRIDSANTVDDLLIIAEQLRKAATERQ